MNIDSHRGVDALSTQAVRIGSSTVTRYVAIELGGFPESGGTSTARQEGDQYIIRIRKIHYTSPKVHDKIYTTDYGTLEVKQWHAEGDLWAIRATGKVSNRPEA